MSFCIFPDFRFLKFHFLRFLMEIVNIIRIFEYSRKFSYIRYIAWWSLMEDGWMGSGRASRTGVGASPQHERIPALPFAGFPLKKENSQTPFCFVVERRLALEKKITIVCEMTKIMTMCECMWTGNGTLSDPLTPSATSPKQFCFAAKAPVSKFFKKRETQKCRFKSTIS